jgi:thiol-disulfide isomerase/thioredoxin
VPVPETFAGQFGVVLFYRGAWCPYCNAQLRAFQRASATLADAGVRVVALSVDDEASTAGLIAKHGLTFPVGFGADARAVAGLTGAFVNPDPVYLQSTGVRPRPGGQGRGERLLQWGYRPAGPRRRRRAGALRTRARRDCGVIP